jgi:hypothetical protein
MNYIYLGNSEGGVKHQNSLKSLKTKDKSTNDIYFLLIVATYSNFARSYEKWLPPTTQDSLKVSVYIGPIY